MGRVRSRQRSGHNRGRCSGHGGGRAGAEQDVHGTRERSAQRIAQGTHQHVPEAVSIHIARSTHRCATAVAARRTEYLESSHARGECRHIYIADEHRIALPKDHIGSSCRQSVVRTGTHRADNNVRYSIAIHIASSIHKRSQEVADAGTDDSESLHSRRREFVQINVRMQSAAASSEYHKSTSCLQPAQQARSPDTDNHITDAITIHIARAAHRETAFGASRRTKDSEPCGGAVLERQQINVWERHTVTVPEDHICSSSAGSKIGVGTIGPDHKVSVTVAVHVAHTTD